MTRRLLMNENAKKGEIFSVYGVRADQAEI